MPRELKEEEGKRYSLSARTSLELNLALKEAAKKSGRSVAQEIEFRLEQSFAADANRDERVRGELVAKAMLGDAETADLIRAMTASAWVAMEYTGGHWRDDIYARVGVISAMNAARSSYFSARPYKDDVREADPAKLHKADSTGKFFGRMLAASQLDPAAASWLEEMASKAPPLPDDMPLMEAQLLEEAAQRE